MNSDPAFAIIPSSTDAPDVCIIGGAIVDVAGYPLDILIAEDSNPGNVHISMGGVGRNIAENLARLRVKTALMSVFGDDALSRTMMEHCRRYQIDIDDSLFVYNQAAPVHMALMNHQHDLHVAITDISLFEKLSTDFIAEKKEKINQSKLLVIDTNMSEKTIQSALACQQSRFNLVDTVSGPTVQRITASLPLIHTLKINRLEAGILVGHQLENKDDLDRASATLLARGVSQVFITLGQDGVHYRSTDDSGFLPASGGLIVNTNGSGDAYCAGVAFGMIKEVPIKECALYGLDCAAMTVSHADTVNSHLNSESFLWSKR